LLFSLCAAPLLAQSPGAYDVTFGVNGKIGFEPWTNAISPGYLYAMNPNGVLELSSGKVLVSGHGGPDSPTQPMVQIARFTRDGALDTSFANGGYASVSFPGLVVPLIRGMVEAPSGNLWFLVDLQTGSGSAGIFLYRMLPGGTLDTTFGTGGQLNLTYGAPGMLHHCQGDVMKFMGAQNGKLLALCRFRSGPSTYANRLLRINADGTVDTAFGSGGTVDFPTFYLQPGLTDFVELADGSVAATGPSAYTGGGVIISKLRPDGQPDASFGNLGNGVTDLYWDIYPGGVNYEFGKRIVADGQRLVVLGAGGPASGFPSHPTFNYPFLIARANADGSPDTSFGIAGRTQFTSPAAADSVFPSAISDTASMGLVRQSDGRFIAVANVFRGYAPGATTNPAYNVLVTRFNNDGSLDSSYATNGQWYERLNLYTRPGNGVFAYEQAAATLLQSGGNVLVTGLADYTSDVNGADWTIRERMLFLFRLTNDRTCYGFSDVDVNDLFCGAINWIKNRGITLGCGLAQYCPSTLVQRDAMAAFMQRLGVAMTSIPIDVQQTPGPIALSTTTALVACKSGPLPTASYVRDAVGSWRLSGLAAGSLDVTATPVWSLDGGATWAQFLGTTSTRVTVPSAKWTQLSGPVLFTIPAGRSLQVGIEVLRTAGTSGANLTDAACQLLLELVNHNGTGVPY